jgi:hypothetical protein
VEIITADEVKQWLNNASVAKIIGTVAGALVLGVLLVFRRYVAQIGYRLWYRLTWVYESLALRWKLLRRRQGQWVVTLELYVHILERFRERTIRHCVHRNKDLSTVVVHAFTRQLPSDWPLWGAVMSEQNPGLTPLEEYYIGFKKFMKDAGANHHKVQVKRVIVIDGSQQSPAGKAKADRLKYDVNRRDLFNNYIAYLHPDADSAGYYIYERPWPNWMSDVVFYGTQPPDDRLRWEYAIMTSYDAGEDQILLRFLRLGVRTVPPRHLPLPAGCKSLEDLANLATRDVRKLIELRTGQDSENDEPLVPAVSGGAAVREDRAAPQSGVIAHPSNPIAEAAPDNAESQPDRAPASQKTRRKSERKPRGSGIQRPTQEGPPL